MEKTIMKKTNAHIKRSLFQTDSLYDKYNFENDLQGETLIDVKTIDKLYKKQISYCDLDIAEEIMEIARDYEAEEYYNWNFNIYHEQGEIKVKIGHKMRIIKENIEEYQDYIDKVKGGIEYCIEFRL